MACNRACIFHMCIRYDAKFKVIFQGQCQISRSPCLKHGLYGSTSVLQTQLVYPKNPRSPICFKHSPTKGDYMFMLHTLIDYFRLFIAATGCPSERGPPEDG